MDTAAPSIALIPSPIPGWVVSRMEADQVDLVTTTHRRWQGHIEVARIRIWGESRCEYYVQRTRPDAIYTYNANFIWKDGRLHYRPSRFKNGRPRPANYRKDPIDPEMVRAAEALIRSMGWEA